MSTILKALRRLESDKSSRIQRPLREQIVGGSEPGRRTPVLLVGIGVFAVGIAIGAAVLLLWPGKVSRPGAETPPAIARPSQANDAKAASRRLARPAAGPMAARPDDPAAGGGAPTGTAPPPRAPRARSEPDVAVVRRIEPPPLALNRGDASPEPRAPRAGEVRPAEEALKPAKRTRPAEVARPAPAEPEPVRVARRPAPEPPPPKTAPAPKPEPLPAPVARAAPAASTARPAAVPVILVSRTHWHPRAERREALLEVEGESGSETRRVREGDSVGPLTVETIEPSGVVFDYAGTQLRHGVGSER